MKHKYRVIAVCLLGLLASGPTHAQTNGAEAARAPAHSRTSQPARAGGQHAASDVTATARAATATPTAAHAAPTAGARAAPAALHASPPTAATVLKRSRPATTAAVASLARPRVQPGVTAIAVRRRAPINAALGGPATYDARKLVRR
jgi:hypothetical protein